MPGEDENVRIRAELEDAVSRPAENAADSLEDLEHAAVKAAAAMEAADKAADDLGGQLKQLDREAERSERSLEQQARAAKQGRDEMGRFTEGTGKSRFELKKFLKVGFGLTKFFKVIKIFAFADGANLAASGLSALGAGGIAAVAGLAPLTGMLVAYPGLFAAGAQGMAAFKIGTKGVGDAIKVLADPKASPEALAEALKNLSPEARKFAAETAGLNKQWKQVRQNVQQELFEGLSKQVRPLGKLYLPILNNQLGDTAHSLNLVGRYTASWLKQKSNVQAVNIVMGQQDLLVRNLGMGVSDLARFFLYVLKAAQPMLQMLTTDFREGLNYLANWGSKNGSKMSQFFTNSYSLLKQVLGVLVDFGMGLYNIFKLSMPLAGDMGDAIHDIAQNFRAWTESAEGTQKIKDFFAYAKPVLWEIGKLIWAVVKGFGSISTSPNLVPTLQALRTEILPAILAFVQQSDGQIIPTLLNLAKSFLSLATNLNIIGPTVEILKVLAAALGWVAEKVNSMSEGQKQFLAWAITASLFVTKFAPVINLMRNFVWQGSMLSKVLGWIAKGFLFLGRALLALVVANPIVAIIVLVIGLLVLMYFKFDWFRNFVNMVWQGIATAGIAAWNWIKMAAQKFWGWIAPVVMAVVGLIISYVKMMYTIWSAIWYAIRLVVLVIIAVIVVIVKAMISKVVSNFRMLSAAWAVVWAKIKPIVQPIIDWIKDKIGKFILGVKVSLPIIADAFKTAFNKVRDFVMPIIEKIKSAIDSITEAVGKVAGGLKGAGDAVGGFIKNNVPFLAKGGALGAGTTAITGERGPEAFVSKTGNVKMLGMNGPEAFRPNLSGYVVPNHALAGEKDSGTPEWALRALSTHRASKATDDPNYGPKKPPKGTPGDGGTKVAQRPVVIHATVRSEADIKKLAAEIRRQDRDDEERKY